MNNFSFQKGLLFRFFLINIIFVLAILPLSAQNFVTPDIVTELVEELKETSGLANLNGEIWTHNDSGDDPLLYQINTSNGNIIRTVEIANATNEDWEDICHDENYVYIGDIGNNFGDRIDLRIYKISRAALEESDEVYAEIIHYSYSDQTSWEPNHNNNDFDCEAMISFGDKLYLFSKNWVDHQTRCYQLSKQAGTHVAEYQSTFDIECLVTGAEILDASNSLVLIGYNTSGGSYTWIFKDFIGTDFFGGTHTKLIWTSLTQIEGVCKASEDAIYISSEKFSGFLDPTLYYLDVSSYFTDIREQNFQDFWIYSNHNFLIIESEEIITATIQLLSTSGIVLYEKQFVNEQQVQVPIEGAKGIYLVVVSNEKGINTFKVSL